MIQHPLNRQTGQALIEGIFMTMVLILLLVAIHTTGLLRSHSLDLLGESSYQTFLLSIKKSTQNKRHTLGNAHESSPTPSLTEQLLHVNQDALIQSRIARGPLYRKSYLLIQSGQSDSARESHHRIESSNDAWLNVARKSKPLLKPIIEPLKRVDAPWGRATLSTDWLGRWAGQVPTAVLPTRP